MSEITKKGQLYQKGTPAICRSVYLVLVFLFDVLEILLALRFVFKLLGANPSSEFVNFIYNLSAVFVAPFAGIFKYQPNKGRCDYIGFLSLQPLSR